MKQWHIQEDADSTLKCAERTGACCRPSHAARAPDEGDTSGSLVDALGATGHYGVPAESVDARTVGDADADADAVAVVLAAGVEDGKDGAVVAVPEEAVVGTQDSATCSWRGWNGSGCFLRAHARYIDAGLDEDSPLSGYASPVISVVVAAEGTAVLGEASSSDVGSGQDSPCCSP